MINDWLEGEHDDSRIEDKFGTLHIRVLPLLFPEVCGGSDVFKQSLSV